MANQANSATRKDQLQKAQAGIGKHFSTVSSLTLGGQSITPGALQALLQSDLDKMTAVAQAKAALKVLIQAEHDVRAQVLPLLRSLRAFVVGQFGDTAASSDTLEDFGFSPRKTVKTSLATKVEAQGKAKATRQARGTKGPKAKQAIKGQVPATPAPPTTPTAPKA